MAKSNEPIFWSLFAGGGMAAAMLMPVAVVLTGIAVPLGWLSEQQFYDKVTHPLGRIFLFVLISLPLFHAAHRLKHTAHDVGLKLGPLGMLLFYGGAAAGTAVAAWLLLSI